MINVDKTSEILTNKYGFNYTSMSVLAKLTSIKS